MTTSIYQSSTLQKRTQNFLNKAKEVHNDIYDYSKVKYINSRTEVEIICSVHGDFPQTPNNHLKGHGCPECADTKSNTKAFIEKANKVHNNYYNYDKVDYIDNKKDVIIECPVHGKFPQRPSNHISSRKSGCPICGGKYKSNTNEFIKKAVIIHNNYYNYDKVDYIDNKKDVIIECSVHGDFPQTPNNHLKGQGCTQCSKSNYSKIAIKWLDSISTDIQHAENGGEFRIPNTRFHVDGYCKKTNTVYEFHGNVYHGNPDLFEPTDNCHPYNKEVTAKELYDNTINREEEIKSLGYNLVVMWEHNFIQ